MVLVAVPGTAPHRPWYRDLVLVGGLSLIALGGGNWATGTARMREHLASVERVEALLGPARDERAVAELEVARSRVDFYHVVASGGRLMAAAGIVVSAFALARTLRGEARRGPRRARQGAAPNDTHGP